MAFWSRWLRREEKSLTQLPPFAVWPESKAGARVSVETALQVSTVLACARAIAEGCAQVPIRFYRGDAGRRVPLSGHPLEDVLGYRPNFWQTSFEFRETLLLHAVLCGNAYVYINRVNGRIAELLPIEPGRVWVERQRDMTLRYRVTFENGDVAALTSRDVWHLRGPSWNAWMGLEAIKYAREAIGLSIVTEEAHSRLHSQGVRPSGLYTVEGTLQPQQYQQLAKWLEQQYAGADNGSKPMILDRGAKWTPLAMSGVDAQHLETRKHQVEEICRAFRVIPLMVGYADKTATYASAEQMFISHVVHTITPWATRFEQSAEAALLEPGEDVDIRLDLKGLMRGAAKDRAEYFAKALGSGGSPAWMTQNEVRGEDGLDWVEGGDSLPQPTNVAPVATEGENGPP